MALYLSNIANSGPPSPLVPPVLHPQRDAGQADAHEDHDEHAADVLYGDAVGLVVLLLALDSVRVVVPPVLLQFLQFTLVQELEYAGSIG